MNSELKNEYEVVKSKILDGVVSTQGYAWIYYHIFNWHILPGFKGAKHSYLAWKNDGFINKRYDWDFLEKEFNKSNITNILLVTGKFSNVTVVDFDSKKEVSGKANYLIEELPKTLKSITGSGGKHYFYKYNENTTDQIGIEGCIDIRSGGLIVLPPSIHENGNIYEWEDEDELFS